MHRDMGQPSLAESLLPETLGHNERLERIGSTGTGSAGCWQESTALEGRPSAVNWSSGTTSRTPRWRRRSRTGYPSGVVVQEPDQDKLV